MVALGTSDCISVLVEVSLTEAHLEGRSTLNLRLIVCLNGMSAEAHFDFRSFVQRPRIRLDLGNIFSAPTFLRGPPLQRTRHDDALLGVHDVSSGISVIAKEYGVVPKTPILPRGALREPVTRNLYSTFSKIARQPLVESSSSGTSPCSDAVRALDLEVQDHARVLQEPHHVSVADG